MLAPISVSVPQVSKVIVDKEPKSRAKKQLSIRFGHIPVGPTTAMDKFFAEWQPQPALNN